jgi:hypothetical protein
MAIDTLVVMAVVLLAAGFIARRVWLAVRAARKPAGGCGPDCGCGH